MCVWVCVCMCVCMCVCVCVYVCVCVSVCEYVCVRVRYTVLSRSRMDASVMADQNDDEGDDINNRFKVGTITC